MHDSTARRGAIGSLAICVIAALSVGPVQMAQAQSLGPGAAGDAPELPAAEEPGQSLVLGFVKAGATLGWDMGGIASAGILVGGPTARLHLAARAMAGMSVDHSDPSMAGGGEVGYRGIWRVHPKFRLSLLVAGSYMFRRGRNAKADIVYLYHLPQGHLYMGLMFGNHPRVSHGVELGGGLGYAVHINPGTDRPDYTGVYGGAELSYVLTF